MNISKEEENNCEFTFIESIVIGFDLFILKITHVHIPSYSVPSKIVLVEQFIRKKTQKTKLI